MITKYDVTTFYFHTKTNALLGTSMANKERYIAQNPNNTYLYFIFIKFKTASFKTMITCTNLLSEFKLERFQFNLYLILPLYTESSQMKGSLLHKGK